jgi:hypothetical protein
MGDASKEEWSFNTKLGIGMSVVSVLLVVAVVIWKTGFTNNDIYPTTPEVVILGTGTPSEGSGIAGNGNTNAAGSNLTAKTNVSKIKLYKNNTIINADYRLYPGLLPDVEYELNPGMKTIVAVPFMNKYVFNWSSMKVEPGTKIMFTRDAVPGTTLYSFAVGQYNVDDLEKWMLSQDRISGKGIMNFGSLDFKTLLPMFNKPIYLWVLDDNTWNNYITEENQRCVKYMQYMGGSDKGFPESNCNTISSKTYNEVYTNSL